MDGTTTFDYHDRGQVVVTANGDELARLAAETLITTAAEAAAENREALVALSGGSTPKKMGELLATPEYADRVHWDNLQIFWGDERWVPLEDSDSNAGEALRTFLESVAIPDENVHPWEYAPDMEPSTSARRYARLIEEIAGSGDQTPAFDLIFLGMGDDGHTLSLFPGTKAVHNTSDLTTANYVEKLNADRVTFTPRLANAAKKVVFLVGGASKAEMLRTVLDGEIDVDARPSQVIRPESGELVWLVDRAAAAKLDANGQ